MRRLDGIWQGLPKGRLASKPKKRKSPWRLFFLIFLIGFLTLIGFLQTPLGKRGALLLLLKDGEYLVLFQNNAELRPAGGFIGSFARIEVKNFRPRKIEFETNIYKHDNEFRETNPFPLPSPFERFWPEGKLSLVDSNWDVSFPKAMGDVNWFYGREYNNKVEGILAINATVLTDFLKLTGPITTSDGTIITADNLISTLAYKIEKEYYLNPSNRRVDEPKSILKEMLPEVLGRIKAMKKIALIKFIGGEIAKKQILFWAKDPLLERLAKTGELGGEVKDFPGDYLYINEANLGGGKSSLKIETGIRYRVTGNNKQANLTIIRTHQGQGEWPEGVTNYSYMRILLPLGITLNDIRINDISILKDVEVTTAYGKTQLGFWIDTSPGETTITELSYQLPANINLKNYQLLIQKQPGAKDHKLTVEKEGKIIFRGNLSRDLGLKE